MAEGGIPVVIIGLGEIGRAIASRVLGRPELRLVGAVEQFFKVKPFGGLPRDVVVALEPGVGEVTRGFYCRGRGACRPEDVKFPETYIVDRAGRIMALVVGDIDWSLPAVRQYLEALIEG